MTTVNLAPRALQLTVAGDNPRLAGRLHDEVTIRCMDPDDAGLLRSFFEELSPSARHRRFMSSVQTVPDAVLAHLSAVDQDRHVAYLAETWNNGRPIMIAEARYVVETNQPRACEFAIAVADGWQGNGLGFGLLNLLERHAIQSGHREMIADTLPENGAMIGLAKRCGFSVGRNQYDFRVKRLTKQVTLH